MSCTAYLTAQRTAALRLGEVHAVRRIERALDGSMSAWVVTELIERLEVTPQPPDTRSYDLGFRSAESR